MCDIILPEETQNDDDDDDDDDDEGGAQVIRANWSECWQSGGPKLNIHPD